MRDVRAHTAGLGGSATGRAGLARLEDWSSASGSAPVVLCGVELAIAGGALTLSSTPLTAAQASTS